MLRERFEGRGKIAFPFILSPIRGHTVLEHVNKLFRNGPGRITTPRCCQRPEPRETAF